MLCKEKTKNGNPMHFIALLLKTFVKLVLPH